LKHTIVSGDGIPEVRITLFEGVCSGARYSEQVGYVKNRRERRLCIGVRDGVGLIGDAEIAVLRELHAAGKRYGDLGERNARRRAVHDLTCGAPFGCAFAGDDELQYNSSASEYEPLELPSPQPPPALR